MESRYNDELETMYFYYKAMGNFFFFFFKLQYRKDLVRHPNIL